ncbi:MAG: hypothetical protein JWM98_3132 [Thermoleophilia bacterium]|nr:hypothetical protein [Thermoleophilia bacterium]
MRHARTTATSLVLLVLATVTMTGCSGGPTSSTTVTRPRLERSLERTYANRYVALSKVTGHRGVTAKSLDAHAVCDKGGPTVDDAGPGGDWICQVAYTDPNVPNPDGSAKVEMNVHSNDCYTAAGSSKLVGPLNIVDTHGHQVVNPAFEFDGCFNPSGSGTPDGTLIIVNAVPLPGAPVAKPALTLPTGLVTPDGRGRVPLLLTCGDAPTSCSGTIDVTVQGEAASKVTYDVPSGGTKTLRAQLTRGQARDGGIITLTLHERTPPPAPAPT